MERHEQGKKTDIPLRTGTTVQPRIQRWWTSADGEHATICSIPVGTDFNRIIGCFKKETNDAAAKLDGLTGKPSHLRDCVKLGFGLDSDGNVYLDLRCLSDGSKSVSEFVDSLAAKLLKLIEPAAKPGD